MKQHPNGFTLVELSIVIVVIGLLVGGVLAGQSLIRNTTLNRIARDLEQFETATSQFNQQYNGLPGDLLTATKYWGSAGGTGDDSTCQSTVTNDARTCNGNGDKAIGFPIGTNYYMRNEQFRAWQQLSNAGLIAGKFTGVSSNTSNFNGVDMTKNASPFRGDSKLGYVIAYLQGAGAFDANYYFGGGGNMILFGSFPYNSWILSPAPSMSPEEMYLLDAKRDDGNPTKGKIRATKSPYSPGCTTSDTSSAQYATTSGSTQTCFVQYTMTIK